jgi:hypothetical protein
MRQLIRLILVSTIAVALQHRVHAGPAGDIPVWLVGNDFHTSLVLRARDVPFRREICDVRDANALAFGWGASADYRGPSTPWTVLQAMFPNRGALHIVPIRGSITRRFPHSDVVLLRLTPQSFSRLLSELDQSFAFTPDHHRIDLGRGVFPDGRFYASRERFLFPYVCNMWVAVKLSRAGVHFFLPRAVLSNSLILQAGEKGVTLQRHDGGFNAF